MKKTYKYVSLILFILAILIITAVAIPLVQSVNSPEDVSGFEAFIGKFGAFGILIMLIIQIAQIVVALIPGELIEFMAGCMYGWLGGLLLCLTGIALGQALVFKMVKVLGKEFVESAAGSKAMEKLKFLKDEKKLKIIIFLLFFAPGTPKDLVTYAVPFTSISLKDFIVLTLVARIPTVVSSTYAGDAFIKSNYRTLLIAYGIIIIVSVLGMGIYKLYEKKVGKSSNQGK